MRELSICRSFLASAHRVPAIDRTIGMIHLTEYKKMTLTHTMKLDTKKILRKQVISSVF